MEPKNLNEVYLQIFKNSGCTSKNMPETACASPEQLVDALNKVKEFINKGDDKLGPLFANLSEKDKISVRQSYPAFIDGIFNSF